MALKEGRDGSKSATARQIFAERMRLPCIHKLQSN